jgi:hypothetical protein
LKKRRKISEAARDAFFIHDMRIMGGSAPAIRVAGRLIAVFRRLGPSIAAVRHSISFLRQKAAVGRRRGPLGVPAVLTPVLDRGNET